MRCDPQRAKALELIELGAKLAERVDHCIKVLGPDHRLEWRLQDDAIETLTGLGHLATQANPDVGNAVVRWDPLCRIMSATSKLQALAAIGRCARPRPRRAWAEFLVPHILDEGCESNQLIAICV